MQGSEQLDIQVRWLPEELEIIQRRHEHWLRARLADIRLEITTQCDFILQFCELQDEYAGREHEKLEKLLRQKAVIETDLRLYVKIFLLNLKNFKPTNSTNIQSQGG